MHFASLDSILNANAQSPVLITRPMSLFFRQLLCTTPCECNLCLLAWLVVILSSAHACPNQGDRTLAANSVFLVTTGGPYGNNWRCSWTIRAMSSVAFVLQGVSISTESCCDKIQIDGTTSSGSSFSWSSPRNIPQGREVSAVFSSDSSVTSSGFVIRVYSCTAGSYAQLQQGVCSECASGTSTPVPTLYMVLAVAGGGGRGSDADETAQSASRCHHLPWGRAGGDMHQDCASKLLSCARTLAALARPHSPRPLLPQ